MIGQRIGPYRITRRLGRGGMGSVFAAVHESIGAQVAIKVLHPHFSTEPRFVQRFHDEARAIAAVHDPGLVTIFGYGQLDGGTMYLLMEYLEGETLARRLRHSGGHLTRGEAVRVARQLATALMAAHDRGIVHCDLKPGNVMLVSDPEAPDGERTKLLDFGLAKLLSWSGLLDHPGREVTEVGVVLGTPMYMAPEQCRGRAHIDAQVDVYSLGTILYQMLAGQPPFQGTRSADLMAQHITEPPVPLSQRAPEAGTGLSRLVEQMLAKAPAERPTMSDVAVRLEDLREDRAGHPPAPAQPQPGPLPEAMPDTVALAPSPVPAALTEVMRPATARPRPARSSGWLGPVIVAGLVLGGGVAIYQLGRSGILPFLPQAPAEAGLPRKMPLSTPGALLVRFRVPREQGALVLTCGGARVPVHCVSDGCNAVANVFPGQGCRATLPNHPDWTSDYDRLKTDPALFHNGSEISVRLTLDTRRPHR